MIWGYDPFYETHMGIVWRGFINKHDRINLKVNAICLDSLRLPTRTRMMSVHDAEWSKRCAAYHTITHIIYMYYTHIFIYIYIKKKGVVWNHHQNRRWRTLTYSWHVVVWSIYSSKFSERLLAFGRPWLSIWFPSCASQWFDSRPLELWHLKIQTPKYIMY